MASEERIREVLDLLTIAPPPSPETVGLEAVEPAKNMRRIVGTKNVVAVGISEKISKGRKTGKLALTFYVEKKISLKKLKADVAVPPTVPESLSGKEAIPTDVVVIGKLRLEAVNKTRNPLQPGNSIAHRDDTAGTFGAVVTKGNDLHILSNSHVLALSGKAKKNDPILYPGPADGGKFPDDLAARLAEVKKFATGGEFVNRADCAIAKPTAARLADMVSEIRGLTFPKGTVKPQRGMQVTKVGRTTGKTTGEIRDVNFRFVIRYPQLDAQVGFLDQVLCTRYTKPGDSGSLVLEQSSGKAVGLHFAGAESGTASVFSPIQEVLDALGVKLVTKSIGGAPQTVAKKKTAAKKKASAKKKTAAKKKASAKKTSTKKTSTKKKASSKKTAGKKASKTSTKK